MLYEDYDIKRRRIDPILAEMISLELPVDKLNEGTTHASIVFADIKTLIKEIMSFYPHNEGIDLNIRSCGMTLDSSVKENGGEEFKGKSIEEALSLLLISKKKSQLNLNKYL